MAQRTFRVTAVAYEADGTYRFSAPFGVGDGVAQLNDAISAIGALTGFNALPGGPAALSAALAAVGAAVSGQGTNVDLSFQDNVVSNINDLQNAARLLLRQAQSSGMV